MQLLVEGRTLEYLQNINKINKMNQNQEFINILVTTMRKMLVTHMITWLIFSINPLN